jgi:hypothetical protein
VASYTPQGAFREAWGWGVAEPAVAAFQRCGPQGEVAHPTCPALDNGSHASSSDGWGRAGEGVGLLSATNGIAVDQTTGNVYVFNSSRKSGVIQVFSADGSVQLGGFGQFGKPANFPEPAESIEEGPGKFHVVSAFGNTITVDGQGTVYVSDEDAAEATQPHHRRLMSFKPASPGQFGNYVYTGRASDIETGLGSGPIASDEAGHIYTATGSFIYELDPPSATPICKFSLLTAAIEGMTVDPETEEVYFFNGKKHQVERLVCGSNGEFVAAEAIGIEPKPNFLKALGFSPTVSFGGTRANGVLYAVSQSEELPGPREVGVAHIFAPAPIIAPVIESLGVSNVFGTAASAHAVVNPKGAAARFVFQYVSDARYQANPPTERFAGAIDAPPGGGRLQSGLAGVPVGTTLTSLQPATGYHLRVVAENCVEGQEPSLCTAFSSDEHFRTFPASTGGSPENRAYELVSPPQKFGGQVWPANAPTFSPSCLECKPGLNGVRLPEIASVDGERIVYQGGPFSATEAARNRDSYLSVRTSLGWQTTTLNPPLGEDESGAGIVGFDIALSRALLRQGKTSFGTAPPGIPNFYALSTQAPSGLSPVLSEVPENTGEHLILRYAGGSTDLSRIFFLADDALTGETEVAPEARFEINRNNVYEFAEGRLRLVNVLPGNLQTVTGATIGSKGEGTEIDDFTHAISADGTRVFWSSSSGQVYVRENAAVTREIPDHTGRFLSASSDGTKVLLTDGKLIEVGTELSSSDLTAGHGGFIGLAGQSEDLSHIYFVDSAVLTGTPNSQGAVAVNGRNNLYSWHDGEAAFIGSLASSDRRDWTQSAATRTAQASPGGTWMAFTSSEPLTGQAKKGPCDFHPTPPEFRESNCTEIFLFEAASERLTCPSCSPAEEGPLGNSQLTTLPNPAPADPQQRYITEDGRLFFDSPNRLSPADSNNGAEDVYEFEPAGVGSCREEPGCIYLMSPGNEFTDGNLLTIDPSGRDLFFTTRQQLSPRDVDGLIDLYDFREGGGIAAEEEVSPAPCKGEACQVPVPPPPVTVPASSGVEEEKPAPTKNGKKRKHKKKKHKKSTPHHSKHGSSPKGGGKKPGSHGKAGGSK